MFQVSYGSEKVDDGNELTPTKVKDPPTVNWGADDGSYYLLCMTGTRVALGDPALISHLLCSVPSYVVVSFSEYSNFKPI